MSVLREQLHALLEAKNAHLPFSQIVENFPERYYNSKFSAIAYSPWQLLEHVRIAQWDIIEFIRNPNHISPDWPEGYWPSAEKTADKIAWEKTIKAISDDLNVLDSMIDDPACDLLAPLTHANKYNIFREILLVADHNAYHLGQFMVLRRLLKV